MICTQLHKCQIWNQCTVTISESTRVLKYWADRFLPKNINKTISAAQLAVKSTLKTTLWIWHHQNNTLQPCKERCGNFWFHPRFRLLTSAVHDFPDSGSCQDVLAAQVVGQLATNGHNDGHHQVGEGRKCTDLKSHTENQ